MDTSYFQKSFSYYLDVMDYSQHFLANMRHARLVSRMRTVNSDHLNRLALIIPVMPDRKCFSSSFRLSQEAK